MSLDGTANMEYASLSGKIHTLVIDKSLTISGACADAKAAGDRIEAMEEIVDDVQNTVAKIDLATPEKVDAHVNNTENPHNVTSEQVNAYSKNACLSAENRTAFGLDEYAGPNDIFGFLGKFNQHWWSIQHGKAGFEYLEKRTVCDNTVTSEYSATITGTVQYSKEIAIDQSTGEVTMVNPQTVTVSATTASLENLCSLAPGYIVISDSDYKDWIFYMPSGVTYTGYATGKSRVVTFYIFNYDNGAKGAAVNFRTECKNPVYLVSSYVNAIPAGETTYVSSADRNAYPDSGEVDGLTYCYLGVPYSKLPLVPKMVIGEYVGTGAYGKDAPNSLEFDFTPKVVYFVSFNETTNSGGYTYVSGMNDYVLYPFAGGYDFYANKGAYQAPEHTKHLSVENGVLTWWASTAASQLNNEATTYHYLAIG